MPLALFLLGGILVGGGIEGLRNPWLRSDWVIAPTALIVGVAAMWLAFHVS